MRPSSCKWIWNKSGTARPRHPNRAQRPFLVARFSPRRNAEDSESIETQFDLCRAYCERHGLQIVAEFEDRALSGNDEDRPGLWAALESLKRGDARVAYKLDRLARDVYLSGLIHRKAAKRGATVQAVEGGSNGDTPEQRMIRQVLQAFAEYERRVIAARTKAAMLRHQAAGGRMSALPPYGWQTDPDDSARLVKVPAEQAVIRRIAELRAEGKGYREIARAFDAEKIPARGKGGWHRPTVKGNLQRLEGPRSLGYKYGRAELAQLHIAVDLSVFRTRRSILVDPLL